MIRIDKGKDGRPISEIASEFKDRLHAKFEAQQSSKNPQTVYGRITAGIKDSETTNERREFLKCLSENEFELLNRVIIATPDDFKGLHQEIRTLYENCDLPIEGEEKNQFRAYLLEVFGYNTFDQTIGRKWLLEALDIKVCPTCNFQFFPELSSRSKSGKPFFLMDIDHFLPQSIYPWFSMSFYNLIPTCIICNRALKGAAKTSIESHLHPYKDSFHENAQFLLAKDIRLFPQDAESVEILVKPLKDIERTKKTIELFRIKDLYQHFSFESGQVLEDFHKYYPSSRLCDAIKIGSGQNAISLQIEEKDFAEIRRKNRIPTKPEDIRNIPLGKLKFDLLQQLTSNLPKPREESRNDQHVEEQ